MNTIVYGLWVEGPLNDLNIMCIRSFQECGHEMIIYSFDNSINPGCEVRDASDILSKDEVYLYKNLEQPFKFGGIAERLKAEMLYKLGGWHVDLDVICLKYLDIESEYVLRPHRLGVVANIIKAPINSTLADYYIKWTKTINEDNTEFEKSFEGLNIAVNFLDLSRYVVPISTFGMDENKFYIPLLQNGGMIPSEDRYAIHFCGALEHYKNYEPDSYYESLLKKYNIV